MPPSMPWIHELSWSASSFRCVLHLHFWLSSQKKRLENYTSVGNLLFGMGYFLECFGNCYLEILSWNKMIKRRRILLIPLVPNRLLSSFLLFPVVSSSETRQIADKCKKLVITFSSQMLWMDCVVSVIVLIMTRNTLPNRVYTAYWPIKTRFKLDFIKNADSS